MQRSYFFRNYCTRRKNIKSLSDERKNKLADSLLYSQFNRDAVEVSENISY